MIIYCLFIFTHPAKGSRVLARQLCSILMFVLHSEISILKEASGKKYKALPSTGLEPVDPER